MWRGTTKWKSFLTHASMVRIGWLNTAKVLIYPIRDNIDGEGNPSALIRTECAYSNVDLQQPEAENTRRFAIINIQTDLEIALSASRHERRLTIN